MREPSAGAEEPQNKPQSAARGQAWDTIGVTTGDLRSKRDGICITGRSPERLPASKEGIAWAEGLDPAACRPPAALNQPKLAQTREAVAG